MGEQRVSKVNDPVQMQKFVRGLLCDVQALEYMLANDWFDKSAVRIGAEQEMVMVDKTTLRPACVAVEALEQMENWDFVETELALFNLETNLTPRELKGSCFRDLQNENQESLSKIQGVLDKFDAKILLTGVLPTLRKRDMTLDNLTPKKRYRALMESIDEQLIGSNYELRLTGIDELSLKHDSPFLEACNTSFQVHLQVAPDKIVQMYNIAQALAGPVIAVSANSPLVFGRRLWHESRIALFQQALDTRSSSEHMRERSPRVSFGNEWLKNSILEIYKEDIARFRVLLAGDVEEDALAMVRAGKVPKLRSLQVHNSTVYRWNRPCYGISSNGKPHLRIENRVIPSGPTVVDEVANAAFWIGCMEGLANKFEDITEQISFEDVRDNFIKASRFGIDTKFTWCQDEKITAVDLIYNKLLPIAREGLELHNVDAADIDLYMGIIEGRVRSHMNGARWTLRAYTKLKKESSEDEALTVLTSAMLANQSKSIPVHEWSLPNLSDLKEYKPNHLRVGDFMTTDLFTVQQDDILDLVSEMMDWRKIRYTPVEDTKGRLIGLVSIRMILRSLIQSIDPGSRPRTVKEIMITEVVTISPNTTIVEAMDKMQERRIGCLPVVQDDELIGIITESDFLRITKRLLQRLEGS
ncbi:MAG: CBS domain-containing protein [Bacteroidetes bacterium]|nr:MAG: CBS domain-containing protein [Bacteroidota bacterium]